MKKPMQRYKKDIKQREKRKFLALDDLVRSSKNVFIKGNSMFLACWFLHQQQTYFMEWLRDKVMLIMEWLRDKVMLIDNNELLFK